MSRPILTIRQSPDALAATIWSAVNRSDIDRRCRGVRPADRRIKRQDAERELRRALDALNNGGAEHG
jgi:hypothetical protein